MCERLKLGDGSVAIVCGGHRRAPLRCCVCAQLATLLCDWPPAATARRSCSKPLCALHAVSDVGSAKDYCPKHAGQALRLGVQVGLFPEKEQVDAAA